MVKTNAHPRRILRLPEVVKATGYKRSSIYLMMARGEFPKCCRLGARAVGWPSDQIEQWINDKLEGPSQ